MSCPTGKIRYRDRLAAAIALASTSRSTASRREEARTYRCRQCRGWHLTSKPAEEPTDVA
ncbi:hypothetical protein EDD93_3696 [Streptomyces sp. 840.1]|nr:hypothetical protein EDD93_3696 [Streptomyces sp. 840.1]